MVPNNSVLRLCGFAVKKFKIVTVQKEAGVMRLANISELSSEFIQR